jgi:hypothetical protein
LQFDDFLFNGILADKFNDLNASFLTDTMGTVSRLIFNTDIPPRIEVDDNIGSDQIQSGSSGFKGNQKHFHIIIFVEIINHLHPFNGWGTAG